MKFIAKDFILTDENIIAIRDECSENYIKASGKRGSPELAQRLEHTVEELLLCFKERYGLGAKCRIVGSKSLGAIHFDLIEYGEPQDPLSLSDAEDDYSLQLLQHYAYVPTHTYNMRRDANVVSFEARQLPVKNKMLKQILLAAVLAVLASFGIRFLPADLQTLISESIIAPIFTKLTAVISAIATPLVFFGVISGITGIGSSSAVGTMGKKLLKNMGLTYAFTAIVFSAFAVFLYPVGSGTGVSGSSVLKDLVQLVLDIVPSNLLECFTIDNDLQVIVIAIFLGIVLLSLGERASKVNQSITLLSDVANKMMTFVCSLLPLIVFLGIMNMMLYDLTNLMQLYKVVIAMVCSCAVIELFLIIRVRLRTKAPLLTILKKQIPTLMINLTTSSQVAALPENMKCCIQGFGIDEKFVNFSLPLGVVAYMPNGAAFIGLLAWGLAYISGISFGIPEIIKIAFVAVIVAIAAPPIPGSALVVLPILFSSCGIPLTYYSVALVCGTILGYFTPALNGFALELELLITANDLRLVDKEKLNRKMQND